jgi:hypothetical protein
MLRHLQSWIDHLHWQRLAPFQKLAHVLVDHLDGILNYCRTQVRFGAAEAIDGNIKTLLRRRRGSKNLAYLLLKDQRMAEGVLPAMEFFLPQLVRKGIGYAFLQGIDNTGL